jgi:hypothetical protein
MKFILAVLSNHRYELKQSYTTQNILFHARQSISLKDSTRRPRHHATP